MAPPRRRPITKQGCSPGSLQAQVRKFGPKLLQLLAEWTETFPRDFQEESTIGHLKDVVGRIAPCDEVSKQWATLTAPREPSRRSLGLFPGSPQGPGSPPVHHNPLSAPSRNQANRAGRETRPLGPGLVS